MRDNSLVAIVVLSLAALLLHFVVIELVPFTVLLSSRPWPAGMTSYPIIVTVTGTCIGFAIWVGSRLWDRWRLALAVILLAEGMVWLLMIWHGPYLGRVTEFVQGENLLLSLSAASVWRSVVRVHVGAGLIAVIVGARLLLTPTRPPTISHHAPNKMLLVGSLLCLALPTGLALLTAPFWIQGARDGRAVRDYAYCRLGHTWVAGSCVDRALVWIGDALSSSRARFAWSKKAASNLTVGVTLLSLACEAGELEGCTYLGTIYYRGAPPPVREREDSWTVTGERVVWPTIRFEGAIEPDFEQALAYFKAGCDGGADAPDGLCHHVSAARGSFGTLAGQRQFSTRLVNRGVPLQCSVAR